jgi:hypothetical protein
MKLEPLSCCGVMSFSTKRGEVHILISRSYIEASITQLSLIHANRAASDGQTDQLCCLSRTQCCSLTKSSSCSTKAGIIDCGTLSARMACACHRNIELAPDVDWLAVDVTCIQMNVAMCCTVWW